LWITHPTQEYRRPPYQCAWPAPGQLSESVQKGLGYVKAFCFVNEYTWSCSVDNDTDVG
jgi:hypothetical protein